MKVAMGNPIIFINREWKIKVQITPNPKREGHTILAYPIDPNADYNNAPHHRSPLREAIELAMVLAGI